jgi:hypothetical protein
MVVTKVDGWKEIHARLGVLLPAERSNLPDTIAVLPTQAGKLQVWVRILATELPSPIEAEWVIEVEGVGRKLEVGELEKLEL